LSDQEGRRRFDDIDYRQRPASYEPTDRADELLCGVLSADLGRPWPKATEGANGGFAYRALNNAGRHYAPDPTLSDEPPSPGELVALTETLRPGGLVKRLLNHAVGAGLRESEIARAI
jgi:hypothetical protein